MMLLRPAYHRFSYKAGKEGMHPPMTDQHPQPDAKHEASVVREIGSAEIFRGQKTVVITHEGVQYRLHVTRNNKLILHK
jgi:hemin uptake protein HemP